MSAPSAARDAVVRLVQEGHRFVLTCHRRPDADALGSALGLAAILRELGKEACVYSVDPIPRNLRFLVATREVLEEVPPAGDACFVMDAASQALVPALPTPKGGPVVMVDHHSAHDEYGDLRLRETDACATAVVVVRLMRALGLAQVPPAAAAPLYAALVADTGGFRYATTDAATLRLGAELLEAGAEPWPTAYHLFEGWTPPRVKLLGALLEGMEVVCDGRLAVMRVTRALLAQVGADDEMIEGMVTWGRTLEGVEVSLMLIESEPRDGRVETKVSLRARGPVDVSRIASALGGGGHRAAAGAAVAAPIEETYAQVRALVEPQLAAL